MTVNEFLQKLLKSQVLTQHRVRETPNVVLLWGSDGLLLPALSSRTIGEAAPGG